MITISEYNNLEVPSYALNYLVNGDASGLEDNDIRIIDNWYQQFIDEAKKAGGHVLFSVDSEEGSFSWHPDFGLACNVFDCTVLIVK